MSSPLTPELIAQIAALNPQQLAFLAGYAWAKSEGGSAQLSPALLSAAAEPAAAARKVTVLSASQTGNARRVAEALAAKLNAAGVSATLLAAADYKTRQLASEDILLLVTSTQGEGEPPEEAVPLHKFVSGKKAPALNTLQFGVLGLGDSSYPNFCQAGKDFDEQLAKLGGSRLLPAGVCDLDYQAAADAWVAEAVDVVAKLAAAPAAPAAGSPAAATAAEAGQTYSKTAPYTANLSVRQKITARNAQKEVAHIEIDLSGSGIRYQAGDALGVWPLNHAGLVDEILQHSGLSGSETVQRDGNSRDLRSVLLDAADITQITPQFVQQYALLSGAEELKRLVEDATALEAYLSLTPPVGVLAAYPTALSAQQLSDLFRPQTPRLYSIASAQDEVGEEVHLTVGVVDFEHHGQHYQGAASGWLGRHLEEGGDIRVFVEPNKLFRLPEQGSTPIIMIGAGTGVAPFRAFMQQREANGDTGRNWLVFGNQKFTDDFLYQAEWLQYRKSGLLTRADLAWSRQGKEKVYVQHKLAAAAAEVWAWLQQGAHIYVCGDASRMARDVEQALLTIIAEQGGKSAEDAEDYLNEMREEKRYQRDVY